MSRTSRHLIVDGYNLIHSLPATRSLMRQGLIPAREALVNLARAIHDADKIRVTVVFDGPSAQLTFEEPTGEGTFVVIYGTAEISADGIIEQLSAKRGRGEEIVVASEDRMIGESVLANGGSILVGADFAAWYEASVRRKGEQIRQIRRKNRECFGSNLGDLLGD
ncbi:MAG: NYN domain-containing protein [Puniceicoccaceae bacterium]